MKVVLSRKGFDSATGGGPSPILPDGRLVSLPIPELGRRGFSRVGYEELALEGRAGSYLDLIRELGLPAPRKGSGAHLDPDLAEHVLPRPDGWRAAFGQCSAAQTHLNNQGVGVGDVFLFFGLFRQTRHEAGQTRWDRRSPKVHALFGYLEVGEVVRIASAKDAAGVVSRLPWVAQHPHVRGWRRPRNTLYVAADRFALAPQRPGAGLLRWSPSVRLSKPGATPSVWQLPSCLAPTEARALSYHGNRSRWTVEDDGTVTLRTVGRGQEFVAEADDPIRAWVKSLVGAAQGTPRGGAATSPGCNAPK